MISRKFFSIGSRGLTLLEALVAVALFSVLMMISTRLLTDRALGDRNATEMVARDRLFQHIGRIAGDPAALLRTLNQSSITAGSQVNPCFYACAHGTTLPPNLCKSGGSILPRCASKDGGGNVAWYPLTLFHPFSGEPVLGPDTVHMTEPDADLRTPVRYRKDGTRCAEFGTAPSQTAEFCPWIAEATFTPMCSQLAAQCCLPSHPGYPADTNCASDAKAYSYLIRYRLYWDPALIDPNATQGRVEMARLKSLESKVEVSCKQFLTTDPSSPLACPPFAN